MNQERSALQRVLAALERILAALFAGIIFVLLVTAIIGLPYALIRASSEWPRWGHRAVVLLAALLLGMGIRIILTRELRRKWFPWIFLMFGPLGPLVYGAMIIVTASAAFGSVTFILVDAGVVGMSSDLPGGVTEGRLVDFYIWHFVELLPLVSINETANLAEPATYSGTWVGLLVLTFQALVVVPILATVRYFFSEEGREARQRYREKRGVMQRFRPPLDLSVDDKSVREVRASHHPARKSRTTNDTSEIEIMDRHLSDSPPPWLPPRPPTSLTHV